MPPRKPKEPVEAKPLRAWRTDGTGYGRLTPCTDKIVTRVDHPGDYPDEQGTFIVTDRLNVFQAYPMLNLLTGEHMEMWLTRTEIEQYRGTRADNWTEPHPRTFDLATIGLVFPSKRRQTLQGFTGGSSYHIVQDKEGHWWYGDVTMPSHLAYWHRFKGKRGTDLRLPELRFLYPHLTYIGPDSDHVTITPWESQRQSDRLLIGTYEVQRLVEGLRMSGVYYPQGNARWDVKLAEQECIALRDSLVANLIDKEDSASKLLEHAQKKAETAQNAAHEAKSTIARLEQDLEELRSIPPSERDPQILLLTKERDQALERAHRAEIALETARECNTGWDWSRVIDED